MLETGKAKGQASTLGLGLTAWVPWSRLSGAGVRAGALATFFLIWYLVALPFDSFIFPGPHVVAEETARIMTGSNYFPALWDTLTRVLMGFVLAMLAGTSVGILMGWSRQIARAFDLIVLIIISVPGLSWALIGILIFGIGDTTAWFVVAIATAPVIGINVWEGAKAVDRDLLQMARAFDTSPARIVRHIVLPQLVPCLLAAARYGLAFAWKAVVIVEMFGLSSGIGYEMSKAWATISIAGVMGWTASFTIVMLAIEVLAFRPLEKGVTAWRPTWT